MDRPDLEILCKINQLISEAEADPQCGWFRPL